MHLAIACVPWSAARSRRCGRVLTSFPAAQFWQQCPASRAGKQAPRSRARSPEHPDRWSCSGLPRVGKGCQRSQDPASSPLRTPVSQPQVSPLHVQARADAQHALQAPPASSTASALPPLRRNVTNAEILSLIQAEYDKHPSRRVYLVLHSIDGPGENVRALSVLFAVVRACSQKAKLIDTHTQTHTHTRARTHTQTPRVVAWCVQSCAVSQSSRPSLSSQRAPTATS